MFCFQCEQANRSGPILGCADPKGSCGKDPATSDLQDLLIHAVKGICQYAVRARAAGAADIDAARFAILAVFTTLTNVNFSATRFVGLLREAAAVRDRVRSRYENAVRARGELPLALSGPATWVPAEDMDGLLRQGAEVGVNAGIDRVGADIIGLRALCLYGLKGICAYAHHAGALGHESDKVFAGIEDALAFLAEDPADAEALLERALDLGRLNLDVMALLDAANTGTYGAPQPTAVRVTPVAGKAILISGHDLRDLAALLEQTRGTGINVYTHGEMLPAHGYPALKAYPHLVGNYGGAWHEQQREFAQFPGPIVMTSNCIIEPHPSYRQRIFTLGPVGWPGVRHLDGTDYSTVVQAAKALPGFTDSEPERYITVGFGRDAVLSVADKVVDAVRAGAIRHFFLIGGCEGPTSGRDYYADFARLAPNDTAILTLGCGKYRFNRQEFGEIGGIPRLLDVGQCNDAYSAIKIALALAEAFSCDVNDLPLTLVLSWTEQKAVAILLTLFALGLRNVHLGPTLPAYVTPTLASAIVDRFGLRPIGDAAGDIEAALARTAS